MKFGVKKNLKCGQSDQQLNFHQSNQLDRSTAIINSVDVINVNSLQNLIRISRRIVWPVIIFFLMLTSLEIWTEGVGVLAIPIISAEQKFEEYYIEHEISSTQAKNSAMTYNINSLVPPPGCQKCTEEELQYCVSSLMNDHCCCDKEYFEKLPFIPHTCYLGTQPCTPIQDCATYARLRDCCCNNILIKKWKAKNSAKLPEAISSLLLIFILFINVLTFYRFKILTKISC